ncbi:uncharacterized protein LOC133891762 isoform X2 [Phragmites australis]|uniref:uncharacterized protein LOC133891762 isoform X2 n=1 Tax=Phragmites australis TaxID=29695 RepID=UPI002D76AE6D|nr:uncharacterized protein LOC133891762 isoform X2 [Phragmites australis]
MRRLPLGLLRSAAASASTSLRGLAAVSCGGWPAPPAPHPTAAPAGLDLVRWPPQQRRGYSQFASGFTPLQPKPLESILDVERAKGLSPEHLVAAWDDYHLGRGHIGASMKTKLYHLLEQRSATCRHFVVPLWKGSGYTTMFMQDAIHDLHRT